MSLLTLLVLAQVSSPIGEGFSFSLTGMIDPRTQVGMSVEGIGGYCSLSGCRLTGNFTVVNGKYIDVTGGPIYSATGFLRSPALSTNTGVLFSGLTTLIYSNGNALAEFNSGTGRLTEFFGITSSVDVTAQANAGAAFSATGTGWLQEAGDTTANIFTRNPGNGNGALLYDDTVKGWRARENDLNWNRVLTFNGDGGFAGNGINGDAVQYVHVGDFYINGVAAEGVNMMRSSHTVGATKSACKLAWTVVQVICYWDTAGTGGGANVIVELSDGTTTTSLTEGLCTTAAFTVLDASGGTANNALVAGTINMQIKNTTNCTVNPTNIHCGVDMYCFY